MIITPHLAHHPPQSLIHWFTWLPSFCSLSLFGPQGIALQWFSSLLSSSHCLANSQALFSWFSYASRVLFHTIRAFQQCLIWPIWFTGSCAMVIPIPSLLSSLISLFLRCFSAGSLVLLGSYSTQLGLFNDTSLDLFGPVSWVMLIFISCLLSPLIEY